MSSSAPTITQLTWIPCTFTTTILRTANNSPTIVHAHRIKIHLVRPIFDVACSNGCVDPSGTDYSQTFEGDITEDRALESAKFSRQSDFTGPPVQVCELAIGQLLANRQLHDQRSCRRAFARLIGEKGK